MDRNEALIKLENEVFDICIIGSGASGAGCALDAVLRGYKVAIIDRGDFSSETSSKSTKLIHGGVRYLEQAIKKLDFGQLKQVRHGLAERHNVLNNAPHLTNALGLIMPVNSWIEGLYFTIGLKIYGLFAKNDSLPKAKWLSKKETIEAIPNISKKIHSSVLYFDGQLNDSRYALAIVQSAVEKGAVAANYVSVEDFVKSDTGKIEIIKAKNLISNTEINIKSKYFINCTGPFSDNIRFLANSENELRIKPSKGVHISMSKEYLKSETAILIPKTKDGRVVFVIPFENEVIVGTTDTPENDLIHESKLLSYEVDYLLETVEPFLDKVPSKSDIKGGFAGLRPLITSSNQNRKETKTLLRDHEIEHDPKSNLISLLGGKWTTYRIMAKDTIDLIDKLSDTNHECLTADFKLVGANTANEINTISIEYLSDATKKHVLDNYGDRIVEIKKILEVDSRLSELIHPDYPYILAEVAYCLKFEMIQNLRDFFARRIRFELLDWMAVHSSLDKVAEIMKLGLNWSEEEKLNQINSYKYLLESFHKAAK